MAGTYFCYRLPLTTKWEPAIFECSKAKTLKMNKIGVVLHWSNSLIFAESLTVTGF
jgi:hypothetical protein